MKAKRIVALSLTLILALQFIALPAAFGDEITSAPTENADGTLTVRETYPATGDTPTFPATINHGGQVFQLSDTADSKDADFVPTKQSYTRTAFSEVPKEGINNLRAYFPATYPIDDGEFQGEIGLDPVTPFTVTERHEAFRVQVDRTTTFYGLPDNDVSRLPTHQDFEVSSAAYPGATTVATLQILDVSYTIAGTDHLGLPNNYTATVVYRGQEEYLELHHYDVTAHYSGELTSNASQMALTGTYSQVAARTEPIVPIIESQVPLAEPEPSLLPFAIAGAAVVVIVALPLLLLLLLSNAKLIRIIDEGAENLEDTRTTKKKPKTKLVCRRRLTLKQGVAQFRIPATVDILSGDSFYLVLSSAFASREGIVEMCWQGKIVAALEISRYTSINFKEMLIHSTEAALMESDLLDLYGTND